MGTALAVALIGGLSIAVLPKRTRLVSGLEPGLVARRAAR